MDIGWVFPLIALETGPAGGGQEGVGGMEVEGGPGGGGQPAGGDIELELGIEGALVQGGMEAMEFGCGCFPGGIEVEEIDGEIGGTELGTLELDFEVIGPQGGPETRVFGESGRLGMGLGGEVELEGAEGAEGAFGGFGGGVDLEERGGNGGEIVEEIEMEVELSHLDIGGGGVGKGEVGAGGLKVGAGMPGGGGQGGSGEGQMGEVGAGRGAFDDERAGAERVDMEFVALKGPVQGTGRVGPTALELEAPGEMMTLGLGVSDTFDFEGD